MKSPTAESSFKLLEAIRALLQCEELRGDDVSEPTHQLIDGVLETAAQLRRECEFPERGGMIAYFADRFAWESRERLEQRIVALVSTLSDEELHASYGESRERMEAGTQSCDDAPRG